MNDVSAEGEVKSSLGESDSTQKPMLLSSVKGTESGQGLLNNSENSKTKTEQKREGESEPTQKDTGTQTSIPSPSGSETGVTLSRKPGPGALPAQSREFTERPSNEVGRITCICYDDDTTRVEFEGAITGRMLHNQVLRNIHKQFRHHPWRQAQL